MTTAPSVAAAPVSDASSAPARAAPPDAAVVVAGVATQVRVSPAKDAEYALGNGPRKPVPDDGVVRVELVAETEIHVYSVSRCCQEESKLVRPGADITIVMPYLPGRVLPLCRDNPLAEVRISGVSSASVSANLGDTFAVPIGDSTDETKTVVVEFLGDRIDPTPIKVTVAAGKTKEVPCVVAGH
jgi:hypothetical protein